MTTRTVGIRELKAQLASYLQLVKGGAIVTITERGKPIGLIVPMLQSLDEKLKHLQEAGVLKWSGRKVRPHKPTTTLRGNKTMSELLLEDRD